MNVNATITTDSDYVLMTAAYNEEAFIESTIRSVAAQSVLPKKWVIVSDGSSDSTDRIVREYAKRYDFIQFIQVTRSPGHSFGSKVVALQKASIVFGSLRYAFIGNIDADVTLPRTYFSDLIAHLQRNPRLALVSGFIHEEENGKFVSRPCNRVGSVPHAAQLMKREAYQAIGGYSALKYGGEDWHAQTCVKMRGWNVQACSTIPIFHHRRTGGGTHVVRDRVRLGKLDYSLGSHPLFEVVKCLRRMFEKPLLLGAVLRLVGFVWCYVWREPRIVSQEFVSFIRKEQLERLFSLFRRPPSIGRLAHLSQRNS